MTVVGKILVFVNLVFSVITAGLIIMVYTTRINWKDAYGKQTAAIAVARADAQTAEAAQAEDLKRKDAEYQQLAAVRTRLEGQLKSLNDQLAKTKADYDALVKANTGGQQVTADQTKELERRKTEVDNLKKLVDERDRKITDIDRQMARLRDESVQYRIQWEQAKERNSILQGQIESMSREVAQLRSQLGGGAAPGAAPAGAAAAAARAEDLRGTVVRVDGDLATITPGSDAGVTVGTELQVYHLTPRPEFLGKLTILNVTPTQAVGRLSGPRARQVKQGDEVAAHVLGGR
ncbi:MAG TPA: hypothetical protein VGF55_30310 [Gemmataceae bacterium]|jgi:peptidoglycan hydrolase CwlO-like protein